jgi:hypothetical protein
VYIVKRVAVMDNSKMGKKGLDVGEVKRTEYVPSSFGYGGKICGHLIQDWGRFRCKAVWLRCMYVVEQYFRTIFERYRH